MSPTVFEDAERLSQAAASEIIRLVQERPDLLLCAATGKSPARTYALLAAHRQLHGGAFERLRVVQLDEWLGLPSSSAFTCAHYLRRNLVEPLRVSPDRFAGFISDPPDPAAECARMGTWLSENGPIDVCVLGLGTNGHVGLNEPADALSPHCHVATLSETSRRHSMLAGKPELPTKGLTLGMADILASHRIVLIVSSAEKRGVLRRVLESDPTSQLPASLLKQHRNVSLLCDRAAAGD